VIVLASISGSITQWISDNGIYAVFVLMALDALVPVGGELIMLFAGVLAAGGVAGHHVTLFGATIASGAQSYLLLALAGSLGYLLGALVGWALGRSGGRAFVERHGRRFHVGPDALLRAERWFERFGLWAVLLGRITPVVRSFISIPAGVFRTPLPAYVVLSFIGSAIWCFGFAAVGWGLGGSWEGFHHSFDYVDIVFAALLVGAVVLVAARMIRSRFRGADASRKQVAEDLADRR
jgi:membrane protein DedA with SNARE-associated domain